MTRELLISVSPGEVRAGLFEDDTAVALGLERAVGGSLLDGIFLGRVLRVVPALPGAFVDLGAARPAFLQGKGPWTEGTTLMVRVVKEPFGEKPHEVRLLREPGETLTAAATRARAPARLDTPPDPVARLAERLGEDADQVVIDDPAGFAMARREPGLAERLVLARGPEIARRLDDAFAEALAPTVALPGGGRLTVESTTAFTVIDVDLAGAAAGREKAARAILRVNLEAAGGVARQLRLRNIGGAIVVDFISMRSPEHRRTVEQAFKTAFARDPVEVEVHGWTRLGHLELTRHRTAPSLADLMLEPGGARRPKSALTVGLELLRALAKAPFRPGEAVLHLHPTVARVLEGPLAAALGAAVAASGRRVSLDPDAGRDPESFDIGDRPA